MRVLMINVVCGIKSTGRMCTDLAIALEKQGHEVKIAYGRENVPEPLKKYAVRIGTEMDVKLHGLKARLIDGAGFGSKKATKRFIEWVEKYNPDVIHLHNIHGYYINIEILFEYLKKCKKRIIWTHHDCWSFTGHTAYCDSINCTRWKSGCFKCPLKKAYPATFIDRSKQNWEKKKTIFMDVNNMTIITPSKWLLEWEKNSFFKDYPIKVINNGIDTKKFYPIKSNFRVKYGIEDKFLLLGVATSWDEMKGYSDYIQLSDLLGEEYVIILVGLTKVQLSSLPKKMIGIERTSSIKELAEIYTAVDLFLNFSYCENYPTVNIEAMACGTPVLTYKTGGSPEIVEENHGYIIKQGDLREASNLIKKLRNIGLKKITIDKSVFDNSRTTRQYLELYSQ